MNNNITEVSQKSVMEQAVPAGYKQTEVGVIPEDWSCINISEVCSSIGDGIHATPIYSDNGPVFFVNGNNLSFGKIAISSETKRTSLSELSKNSRPLTNRSVLISINGTIGNLAFYNGENIILGKSAAYLNIKQEVVKEFIYYCLSSNKIIQAFHAGLTGSTIKNLGLGVIRNTCIPLPSPEEQTAIANALSDVDALLDSLEALLVKKQAIKTAAMQQLLTGRTRLPQFAFNADGSKKGYKPSELGEIPADWDVKSYGEIFTFLSTSTNSRADLSIEGDYGYIHYGDIHTKWNNKLDISTASLPKVSKHLITSVFIADGDIVMADASEDYEGIGKSIEVSNVGKNKVVAGLHTFLLRDNDKLLSDGYRGYLHNISLVKNNFDKLATGMKVYGISKANLNIVLLPLPSKEEQTAIATILSDMDEELQALEQQLSKTRQLKQGMMQQLLTGKIRLPVASAS